MFKIKVRGKLKTFEFDERKFLTELERRCAQQTTEAIKVWLKERLEHIPGYTGTARGTLVPVGRLVGVIVKKFRPGDPLGDAERAKKKKKIYYGGRVFKAGFKYGPSYAEAAMKISVVGGGILCSFTFDNDLPYVARNDISGPPPGFIMPSNPPWRSQQKAIKVWVKYVKTVIPRKLNAPFSAVKITTLRLS